MSESDSDDQQVEKIKAWWKTYGNALLLGITVGVAALFGTKYWTEYQNQQAQAASAIYDEMLDDYRKKTFDAARESGNKLMQEYAATPYAGLAAMLLARVSFDAGKIEDTRRELQWALDHATDEGVRHTARLRLARVLADAQDINAAQALLDVSDTAGFGADYNELRGDLAAAQGDNSQARKAYREALTQLDELSQYRLVLNMKIDNLGPE